MDSPPLGPGRGGRGPVSLVRAGLGRQAFRGHRQDPGRHRQGPDRPVQAGRLPGRARRSKREHGPGLFLGRVGRLDLLHRGRLRRRNGRRRPHDRLRPGRLRQDLQGHLAEPEQAADRLHPGFQPVAGRLLGPHLLHQLLEDGPPGRATGPVARRRLADRRLGLGHADPGQDILLLLPGLFRTLRPGSGPLPLLGNLPGRPGLQKEGQGGGQGLRGDGQEAEGRRAGRRQGLGRQGHELQPVPGHLHLLWRGVRLQPAAAFRRRHCHLRHRGLPRRGRRLPARALPDLGRPS